MNNNNNSLAKLLPMMLCFFAMGFVDLVGIASNYVKADLNLTDSQANIFPSLVFFWFLIFSVPTGMLMNRIGRKKTVLLSLVVTFASLLLPVFGDGYALMLISFSLLGIGNALMQTSLNPLLSNVVSGERLASSLTFGQFVKAIASFLAPYIAMWGATQAIPSLGMGWRVLFPVYMVIAVVAILWLGTTSIREEKEEGRPSTFGECLALLGKPFILLCFLGIMCHVGIDVGTNTTAPKILMERHFPYGRLFPRSLYFAEVICANFLRNQCVVYAGGDDRAVRFPGDDDDICVYRSDWFRQLEYLPCYFLASVAGDAAEEERSQRVDDYGVVWRYNIPACHGCGK